jgi:hypothetical protein
MGPNYVFSHISAGNGKKVKIVRSRAYISTTELRCMGERRYNILLTSVLVGCEW